MKYILIFALLLGCTKKISQVTNSKLYQFEDVATLNFLDGKKQIISTLNSDTLVSIVKVLNDTIYFKFISGQIIKDSLLEIKVGYEYKYKDIKYFDMDDNFYFLGIRNYIDGYLYKINRYDSTDYSIRYLVPNYQDINVFDDKIYLFRYYNYHPKTVKNKAKIFLLDQNLDSINALNLNISGIEHSHFKPCKYIDMSKITGRIIYTQVDKPIIYLLNKELNYVDSVKIKPKHWNFNKNLKQIRDSCGKLNARERIKYLSKQRNDGLSTIKSINFLNDSTIILAYLPGKNRKYDKKDVLLKFLKIKNNRLVDINLEMEDEIYNNYFPVDFNNTKPIFSNNLAYLFTLSDYNEINSFGKASDWINYNLALLSGSNIDQNLVVLKYGKIK